MQPLRTFLHQPPRTRTPASPPLRVGVSRPLFHLVLTCIFIHHSTLVLCRGAAAEHTASKTLPEEKGSQGNMKPKPRIKCKWLSDTGHAIITKHWRLFLSKSNGSISYLKKNNVKYITGWSEERGKNVVLWTEIFNLICTICSTANATFSWRYTLYFCNIIFCSACLIRSPKHTLGTQIFSYLIAYIMCDKRLPLRLGKARQVRVKDLAPFR